MSAMYSKAKIAGHPIHPMLIAFPVTFYTTTFFAFLAYAVTDYPQWWQIAVRANVAGVITAAIAAIPGLIDWMFGIPKGSPAKITGRNHMLLNLVASALFVSNLYVHRNGWRALPISDTSGVLLPDANVALALSGLGLGALLGAGFLGWKLVQTHHVGVDLTAEQDRLQSHTLR